MNKLLQSTAVALSILMLAQVSAEERNGLLVNVTKRTLDRSDRRDYYGGTRIARTQGVRMVARNTSLRQFGEGEITWTLLVRRTSEGTTEKYVGKQPLKPLRPAESVDLIIGAVPIGGYRSDRNYKDELDYDILITHGGKESIRVSSAANFAAMARGATLMNGEDEEEGEGESARMRRSLANGATPAPGAAAVPGTAVPPMVPGTPPMPVTGATTANTTPQPAGGVGATPAAQPAAVTNAPPPPPAPPVDVQPFDFFNLGKKKPAPTN
jgi:hypothetical protein